jgi:NADH-quinone oxidoreductase subunit C
MFAYSFPTATHPVIPTATDLGKVPLDGNAKHMIFFGINFSRSSVRILNVDEMTVFPMRREYPLKAAHEKRTKTPTTFLSL